jgi:hypothetical protein
VQAFDPQQMQVYGALLAPFLVCVAFGFLILTSRFIMPTVGMHMVRCLVPATIWGSDMDRYWIYVVADIFAAMLHAVYHRIVPPHHIQVLNEVKAELEETASTASTASPSLPSPQSPSASADGGSKTMTKSLL